MAEVDWSALARRIRGTLVLRTDESYGEDVKELVWNATKPDRMPRAIVQVAEEADVREAVLFARANGLKVVARGGGHNWNGAQVREGRMVIDLSQLNAVHIDTEAQTALIQPVVTNEQNVKALGEVGLAFPVGNCPTVSASGYLLGGGLGINTQLWGTGCQNVEAVHLVNARGESLVADATHNEDLFWAVRGGAQGFPGIVTRYQLKAHPLPPAIHMSIFSYHLEDSQPFLDWLSGIIGDLPQAVYSNTLITSTMAAIVEEDLEDMLPTFLRRVVKSIFGSGKNEDGERRGWLTYVAAAFAETEDEARQMLAPFATPPEGPEPIHHFGFMESSFKILNTFVGTLFPQGRYYVADYHWMDSALSLGGIVQRLSAEFTTSLDADSFVLIASYQTPPAEMRPPGSTCFSLSANNLVGLYGIGDEPSEVPKNQEWVAKLRDLLAPDSIGLYIGEADLDVAPGRAAKCYTPEAWARLRELKKAHDPDDFFPWFLNDESPSAGSG